MTKAGSLLPDPVKIAERFGLDNVQPIPGDASVRLYFRGKKQDKSIIVMLYPDASEENQTDLRAFLETGKMLAEQGIKVAKCYEANESCAYALLEDIGTQSFGDALREGSKAPKELYNMATQALTQMRDIKCEHLLQPYKQTNIYSNRRQLIDYYMTFKKGVHPGQACIDEFHALWNEIEKKLPPCPHGFVHGDYHLENLIFAKSEKSARRCAVIDHQDAFYGPSPYDLVNLLEDARTDVSADIRSAMIEIYTKNMSVEDKAAFMQWYRVLAAQFHSRVIGLFIKFSVEKNRDSYLVHIPRLQNYLSESLTYPVLAPLKEWFDKVKLDFDSISDLDGDHIRAAFK